ncbi:MAG: methyltransferase domain-containing protein [Holosporales bacterium]|nr:methyltransferase domain-containing protein [Holosporales bacterium]
MTSSVSLKFDRAVSTYDTWSDIQVLAAQKVFERLPVYRHAQILEIGCGTGQLSRRLLHQYRSSRILLVDIAPNMVAHCAQKLGHHQNVSFEVMDAELIRVVHFFDLIISSMTVHWFSHISETLQHLKEALRPGGSLVFCTLGPSSLHEWREAGLECNVDLGVRDFPSRELFEENLPGINLQTHTLYQRYDSSWHFLRMLKNIGGTAAREGHRPVSAAHLKEAMHILDRKHPDGTFITYELLCGHWTKRYEGLL